MFTLSEKAKCVIFFADTKSYKTTQRRFRTMFNKEPPTKNSIRKWYRNFWNSGCIDRKKRTPNNENRLNNAIEILEMTQNDPSSSTRKISSATGIPKTNVHNVMKNVLKLNAYKIQIHQELKETDFPKRVQFCRKILNLRRRDRHFLDKLIMSDEASFHLNGKVNKHNCRVWASENPRNFHQYVRSSPKVTVWCAVSKQKIYGPFF